MRVPARHPRAVLDDDEPAVAAGVIAGRRHAAAAGGADRRAARRRVVDPGVHRVPARAEAVAGRDGERRGEPQHRARRRAPQRGDRRGPGQAVGAEAGERLEALERRLAAGAEVAVEQPRGEAVAWPAATAARRRPSRCAPAPIVRRPSAWRPRQPSARRVRGPATPSAGSPRRSWNRRTPSLVPGPRMPSTVAAYVPLARSATWSAAVRGAPGVSRRRHRESGDHDSPQDWSPSHGTTVGNRAGVRAFLGGIFQWPAARRRR